jgi:hypothetical protein
MTFMNFKCDCIRHFKIKISVALQTESSEQVIISMQQDAEVPCYIQTNVYPTVCMASFVAKVRTFVEIGINVILLEVISNVQFYFPLSACFSKEFLTDE